MAASLECRPQDRDIGVVVMREVDENMAIFLRMRNGEKERKGHLFVEDSLEFDDSIEPKTDKADDNVLNMDSYRSDGDRVVAHCDIPFGEVEGQDSAADQTQVSNGEGISKKSEVVNTREDSSVAAGNRKPTPRAATPTVRSAFPAKSKPSRASTPTSRATLPSKSANRSATPTREPATPSTAVSSLSAPVRSSSGRKMGPTMSKKNSVPSHGPCSQTVKSGPLKSSEKLPLSCDATQNPKTCMPKRPSSPATNSSSCNVKLRQKSLSPAKVRGAHGTKIGSTVISRSRGCSNGGGDDVNPVLLGMKMVARVVNMRKLAPPRQDEYVVSLDNPRKSSHANSGFGRSLSKNSLDMAIRHMDVRRSLP